MDIFKYIEIKKNNYEAIKNEYSLFYKKNQSMLRELADRLELLQQQEKEADFQGRFSSGKKVDDLELSIEELENRIRIINKESKSYQEKIQECEEELGILNDLEIPFFENPVEREANLKEKIKFCSQIVLQDSQRCKIELEELFHRI